MKRTIVAIILAGAAIFCGAGCLSLLPKGESGHSQQNSSDVQQQEGPDAAADDHAGSRDAGLNPVPSSKGAAPSEFAGGGVVTERTVEPATPTEPVDLREPAPQQQPVQPPAQTARAELLPQSDDRKLSRNDLAGLSNWQLTLARNEIYARHGRPFSNAAIRAYFTGTGWYSPNSSFSESWLSSVEQQNAAFVRDYQSGAFGSPATSPGGGASPQPQQQPTTSGELLPQSDDRKLSVSDLSGMGNWRLTLARNEIYARHGRPFSNSRIRAHFQATGWYTPQSGFSESWLSGTERRNADFIREYQERTYGSPATRP